MIPADVPTPSDIADRVMAVSDQGARIRHLRAYRTRFDTGLVEAFRLWAEATQRRDPREAGRAAQLGVVVAEAIQDRPGRLGSLFERAKAAVMCGDSVMALDVIGDAAHLAREMGDGAMQADLDLLRAQPLTSLERRDEARASAERALSYFRAREDRKGTILAHLSLADLAFRGDRPREALRHYGAIDRRLAPDASAKIRGVLSMNRANSLVACNRFRAAERHFDRARELFRRAGCEHSVAQVDYNAAYGELLSGRYRDALRRHAQCEAAFRRADDVRHLAHIDLDRAEIHLHLNLPDEAAAFATSAEVRFLTLGLVKERAQAAYVYARAAELRGDANTATTWFERAERLFRDLGLTERAVSCIVSRAEVLERQGDEATARELARSARLLLADGMNALSAGRVALLDARLAYGAGDFDAAIAGAESALATCRRIHAPWLRIECWRIVGRARAQLLELAPAIAAYESAVVQLDRSCEGVPPGAPLGSFLAGHADLGDEVSAVLTLAGEPAGALETAERSKSRAIFDLVAGRRAVGVPADRDGLAGARARRLRDRYAELWARASASDSKDPARGPRNEGPCIP